MIKKSKTLKNLLTTISSLVVINSGIAQVEAGPGSIRTGAGAPVVLTNGNDQGGNILSLTTGAPANFQNAHAFVFTNATTITTGAATVTVRSIDLNNFAAGPFTIAHNTNLGSAVDTGGANRLNIIVNDGQLFTLTGTAGNGGAGGLAVIAANTYTGLGTITLGSGLGADGQLSINSNTTLTMAINGSNVNKGSILVRMNKTVVFDGIIGATSLNQIQIGAGGGLSTARFNANVTATKIDFRNAGSVVELGNNVIVTGDIDAGVGGGGGILTFLGSGRVTGKVGQTNPLAEVNVAIAGSTVIFNDTVRTNAKRIGALAGAATAVLDGAAISINTDAATDTEFNNVASVLKLQALGGDANVYTLENHINPGTNGNGIIVLNADGDDGLGTDSALTFDGNGGVKTIGAGGNNIAELRVTGSGVSTIGANIDYTAVPLLNVKVGAALVSNSASAFSVAATHIGEVGGKGSLTIDTEGQANRDLLNAGKTIGFDHADSMLTLTNNTGAGNTTITLHANLVPAGDDEGNLTIISSDGQTITIAPNTPLVPETIGTALARLRSLTIGGDEDTTINVPVYAKKINIGNPAGGSTTFGAVIDAGVGGVMKVTEDGTVAFQENTGISTIDLAGHDVNIDVTVGKILSVDKISNPAAGSTLDLTGAGTSLAPYTALGSVDIAMDKFTVADAGNTNTLAKGKYTGEIELQDNTGILELADGVDLEKINSAGGDAATVRFLGNGKVRGVMGTIANPVGVVTVGANGTLELGGSVVATSIDGQALPNEIVKFINAAAMTVTGNLGTTNKFKEFEFNGAKVTLPAGFVTDKFNFTNAAGTEVVTTGVNVIQGRDVANTHGGNKITVDDNQIIDRALGTNAIPFGTVHITNGDKTIEIRTADFYAGVTTAAGNNGTVIFNFANAKSLGLGEDAARLNKVKFTITGSVKGDIFAKDAEVALGQTANIAGGIKGDSMYLVGAGSKTNFTEDAVMDTAIIADAPGEGIVNFEKKATVSKAIVGVKEVNFNVDDGATEVILSENIGSLTTNFKKSKTSITKDLTLDGIANFNNTDISFGQKDLTITGPINMDGDVVIHTTGDEQSVVGNLVTNNNANNITLNGTLQIDINDDLIPIPANGQELILIVGNTNGIDLSKIKAVSNNNKFSQWDVGRKNGNLVLTQESQVEEVIESLAEQFGEESLFSKEIGQAYEDSLPHSPAGEFIREVGLMDDKRAFEAIERVTNTTTLMQAETSARIIRETDEIISSRITNITTPKFAIFGPQSPSSIKRTSDSGAVSTGLSAGDDPTRYGVWGNPYYSDNTQKRLSNTSGYRAKSYGGTVGFDTKTNDETVLGAAFTLVRTDVKHKDFKSGDTTKIDSMIFSLYGVRQINDKWFTQGVVSFGTAKVKGNENRFHTNTTTEIAKARYNSTSYAGDFIAGYNHVLNDNVVINPIGGLGYTGVSNKRYKESGTTNQNLDVTRKASQRVELIAGLRGVFKPVNVNNVEIITELHGFVRHDLIGKDPKVQVRHEGASNGTGLIPVNKSKTNRTFYNVGTSVNTSHGFMEYGAGYDLNLSKKYVGHQGSLKVRVNF